MGQLQKIDFDKESEEIKPRVKVYWKSRAQSFLEQRRAEVESEKGRRYLSYILDKLPQNRNIKILDVGCGTAFFEVLLGREGYSITGIDLTPEMVEKGNALIAEYGLDSEKVNCRVMDAEMPDLPEESFDVIITRNLTWTLPHPIDAYKAWYKLLKKDGLFINFDAEYAKGSHKLHSFENRAHEMISLELKDECHHIYHMLTISALDRPEWDTQIMEGIGYNNVIADLSVGELFYKEMDEFHIPENMFCITARK